MFFGFSIVFDLKEFIENLTFVTWSSIIFPYYG